MSHARSMSLLRKLCWSTLVLLLGLVLAEMLCRTLVPPDPPDPDPLAPRSYPDRAAFLADQRVLVRKIRSIPPPPPLVIRVADFPKKPNEPNGVRSRTEHYVDRSMPGSGPRVLLFGGSAAFGYDLSFEQSLAQQVQRRLRQAGADPALRVFNLAGLGLELNTVADRVEKAIAELSRPPAAVVVFAGNNEFLQIYPRIGDRPWERFGLYRSIKKVLLFNGLLPKFSEVDPAFMFNLQYERITSSAILDAVWRPSGALEDAQFWPGLRRIYLDAFEQRLTRLVDRVTRVKIPVVLVPPPVNLHFFPGYAQHQPLTTAPVGRRGYDEVFDQLSRALAALDRGELDPLRALVRRHPSGPLQLYALAQQLDLSGDHRGAAEVFGRAQELKMGALSGLHSMATVMRRLRGPGVKVVSTGDWYSGDKPVIERSKELFIDSCHPRIEGVRLLARGVTEALISLGVGRPRNGDMISGTDGSAEEEQR